MGQKIRIHLHSWEWFAFVSILAGLTKNRRDLRKRETVSPLLTIIGHHMHQPPTDEVVGLELPTDVLRKSLEIVKAKLPAKEPHDLRGDHAVIEDVERQLVAGHKK